MEQQNFKNHTRWVPGYHFALFAILILSLVCSIIHFYNKASSGEGILEASILLLLTLAVILVSWYARTFALKAQDRAIRAEENFRYFILTGKPFDTSLRMSQIIALRFASNEELVGLTEKVLKENLGSKAIKAEIKDWRADHNRA